MAARRPCTGTKYWEPDNCPHCLEMVNKFKAIGGAARRTQLSKIRTFLTEAKLKIEHKDPHKRWEFMPIYEYTFTKLNDSQSQQGSSQLGAVGYINMENAGSHTSPRTCHTPSEYDTEVEDNPSSTEQRI